MRVALDTSILVAASVTQHAHHERARVWLAAARGGLIEAMATTHAFAELWATLTALPIEPRVVPADAEAVVARLAEHVCPRPVTWRQYQDALRRCSERGLRSGSLYDALHVVGAESAEASVVLTFNTAHFLRLARDGGPRVLAPPDPPSLVIG